MKSSGDGWTMSSPQANEQKSTTPRMEKNSSGELKKYFSRGSSVITHVNRQPMEMKSFVNAITRSAFLLGIATE